MYILTVHWDLIALWVILTLTAKLYMACLLARIDVFEPCAAFAFLVFGVVVLLHPLPWISSARRSELA